ncbi:nitric oxide synthase oxygenase [Dactylosporangium roseum]|uniref:Nitric oxide synthase oxygenase n=1 Tax=Dactylosporangium roseum TaxID=47989 RepID=A0ABY5ZBB1_9ACTN|nr:nitric oxide synthase oxygenase [Dactylosporangium roseum]UWZ39398.1 nitric oxide synthase oxygenase [Dactylosporangium roseum]
MVMHASSSDDPVQSDDVLSEAMDFLRECGQSGTRAAVSGRRLAEASAGILAEGTYPQTYSELVHGARLAWRNALDCLGRPHWNMLHVRDARDVRTPDECYDACVEHLRFATNGGKIRLVLTAFPQRAPGTTGWRIWNSHLVRYAGYRTSGGAVMGDPDTADLTQFALELGWPGGAGTPFDVLPLIIQPPDGPPQWYPLPEDAVLQVPLSHPEYSWFEELELKWYAHPAISNHILRIGGVEYPAAPFSGWYTCTEVAARNLSDQHRYNALPSIAGRMGLDQRSPRSLWQDRALTELLRAVLHSYDQHGVTMVDHHFAAEAFVRHEHREAKAGRTVPARWRSLVAPTAASTTPTFTREYPEEVRMPNFFRHPDSPRPAVERDPTVSAGTRT